MEINSQLYREAISHFATGVTIVTTCVGNNIYGLTVNSFCSLSLSPTLLLVCINSSLNGYRAIIQGGRFAVNILSKERYNIAEKFSDPTLSCCERFKETNYQFIRTGSPVFPGSIAWFDCNLYATYPGGDHTIFIGEVLSMDYKSMEDPLIFYRSHFLHP